MSSARLTVLTWNIGFGSAATLDPLVALRPLPNVVTLQEVKIGEAEALSARLRDVGFDCVYSGLPSAGKPEYGNVIAARLPLTVGTEVRRILRGGFWLTSAPSLRTTSRTTLSKHPRGRPPWRRCPFAPVPVAEAS